MFDKHEQQWYPDGDSRKSYGECIYCGKELLEGDAVYVLDGMLFDCYFCVKQHMYEYIDEYVAANSVLVELMGDNPLGLN